MIENMIFSEEELNAEAEAAARRHPPLTSMRTKLEAATLKPRPNTHFLLRDRLQRSFE